MQSMKGINKHDILDILDKIMKEKGKSEEDIIGTLVTTREFGTKVHHNVIVLYTNKDMS